MGLLLVRHKRIKPGSALLPNKLVPLPVELSNCSRGLPGTTRAMFWRPSVEEIGDWFAETGLKFAQQENTNPCRSASDFLQRYVFADVYENFFGTIHIELHQWLSRLTE